MTTPNIPEVVQEAAVNGLVDDGWLDHDEPLSMEMLGWIASAALTAALPHLHPVIETRDELDALPLGSLIHAHWPDGSQPDQHVFRCEDESGVSVGYCIIAGGRHWLDMIDWGAELTVLYMGGDHA